MRSISSLSRKGNDSLTQTRVSLSTASLLDSVHKIRLLMSLPTHTETGVGFFCRRQGREFPEFDVGAPFSIHAEAGVACLGSLTDRDWVREQLVFGGREMQEQHGVG